MMWLNVSKSLIVTIFLGALSYETYSAPSHHLTIGVQGNTPTLMVTSSEIGIIPQTKDSSKFFDKYNEKSVKYPEAFKKPFKNKMIKNLSLLNKKDKSQYIVKLPIKQISIEEGIKNSLKNKEMALKPSTTSPLLLDISTTTTTTTTAASITTQNQYNKYNINTQFTTLPTTKQIDPILISSSTAQVSPMKPEEISSEAPKITTDIFEILINSENNYNPNNTPAMSTTFNPQDLHYMTTKTNNNYDTNAAIILSTLTQLPAEAEANNFVSQVPKITTILPDTSVIRTADDNDSDSDKITQETFSTTEIQNLLLTKIETEALTTPTNPAEFTTPTSVSLITDNIQAAATSNLSLSLTRTTETTENVVDNEKTNTNEEQQKHRTDEYSEEGIYRPTKEAYKEVKEKKSNSNVIFNPKMDNILMTAATQRTSNKLKSTENPLQEENIQTTQESVLKATGNEFLKNKTKTETLTETQTTPTTFLSQTEQQVFHTLKKKHKHSDLKKMPANQAEEMPTTATTERVLKLIDLEKHVQKTVDELKQSSLLTAGQHDNGHDGLKNIKKKQLIDKHYLEPLLHNKPDAQIKDTIEGEKYLTQTTEDAQRATSLLSNSSHLYAASNKSILMPIKHGYLGPILMEEKTFHVITHHVQDIESKLRTGHFMELKAKAEASDNPKEVAIYANTKLKNSSYNDDEIMKMQSDQPAQNLNMQNLEILPQSKELNSSMKMASRVKDIKQADKMIWDISARTSKLNRNQEFSSPMTPTEKESKQINIKGKLEQGSAKAAENFKDIITSKLAKLLEDSKLGMHDSSAGKFLKTTFGDTTPSKLQPSSSEKLSNNEQINKTATVLSTTVFHIIDSVATQTPIVQAETLFTTEKKEKSHTGNGGKEKTESKISDIQVEVYDSTIDSIIASTNFKDIDSKHPSLQTQDEESFLGKTTKPPIAAIQQERFTQYVIDRTETSTHEPINFSTIQVASGKPEPAAIEIHINVSESFGNESEDLEFSYPQTEYGDGNNKERIVKESYDNNKGDDNIKLKIPSNSNVNGRDLRNDEILVVEIVDTGNNTDSSLNIKSKNSDDLVVTDVKSIYSTPPPPPPPPPYQTSFDRDSDTIFYISNTEVKVGESIPTTKNSKEERKLKLESQFFPVNYVASTRPNSVNVEDANPSRHLYEEDIILSSRHNQADSLKIYRNNNEPPPPLDVTYVGESIIEVEQSPESIIATTYAPDQQQYVATPQPDVIIQPAILPEISIGVPVIGELPPQIELKEIDFMPNEAQLHRSSIYYDNDNNNSNNNNNMFANEIDENTINGNNNNNNHDINVASGNMNSNPRVDESSIQYGGDLIDESADGGFDGVEGSYPFGNPVVVGKTSSSSYSSAFLTKLRKQQQQQQQQQPNHVADYAHLYVNYGVNNMRKDELSADVKDSGEILLVNSDGNGNTNVASNEQNITSFKDFLNKVSNSNATVPFMTANSTQSESMSNATAFSVMEDVNDLDDKNTEDIINLISLAIGLFIVILPVVVTCSMFWALRYLYKKYHSTLMDNGGYVDQTETKSVVNEVGMERAEFAHETSSSPTNSNKDTIEKYADTTNKPSTIDSNYIFSSEKLTPQLESFSSNTNATVANYLSASTSKKNEILKLSLPLSSPIIQKRAKPPQSASSSFTVATTREYIQTVHGDVDEENSDDDDVEMPGPNGSITKMTLENNLLTVETEVRNDISRVARETKMDYNKDGVFVVEVSRGIDSKTIPESPVAEGNEKTHAMFDAKENNSNLGYRVMNEKSCVNNEKVQIHSPPPENQEEGPRSLHQIEEVEEPANSPQLNENKSEIVYKSNTGLSQSDLSTTSSSNSNKGYCYGNQQLYVAEQICVSTTAPIENVFLKCDIKDIKDDDRNPGNDHYLKYSPDKKEELGKQNTDFVEDIEKSKDEESKTNSGQTPEQTENGREKVDNTTLVENNPNLQDEEKDESKISVEENMQFSNEKETVLTAKPTEVFGQMKNFHMPVEIEIKITPDPLENNVEDINLSVAESKTNAESFVINEIQEITPPVILEKIHEVLEESLIHESSVLKDSTNEDPEAKLDSNIEQINDSASELNSTEEIAEKAIKENIENSNEIEIVQANLETIHSIEATTNGILKHQKEETEKYPHKIVLENGLNTNNDSTKTEETKLAEEENTLNTRDEAQRAEVLNCSIETNLTSNQLQNGHPEVDNCSISLNETENGFDSIMSLPEPPPTTDELLNSDSSDQQLDSLPPPPPPEIFNLKDLPPPLTNGSEESTNFYKTLPPPPPPTILKVTASAELTTTTTANGKVHASPLTPPASPPAHYTNNLHAGLCSQPIAVDVNGS